MGAKHVFADAPTGNVRHRKGLNRVRKVMREGDTLIFYNSKALGRDPRRSAINTANIEASGVTVRFMDPDAVRELMGCGLALNDETVRPYNATRKFRHGTRLKP